MKCSDIRVLIACEESQRVCIAFRERGFTAYSCDIQDCSGDHPEWHIKDDVLNHLGDGWDLMIAHPPCTYLSAAGAVRMYPQKGIIDKERYRQCIKAREFFMRLLNADIKHIAVENPRPLRVAQLPICTQKIQPYMFGDPYSKLTYIWTINLPLLVSTEIVDNYIPWVSCGTSRNKGKPDKQGVSRLGGAQKVRSKTFPGTAAAMAEQWGEYVYKEMNNRGTH